MAKLTTAKAAHHLRYAEREIARGRGNPRLAEIAEHRRAYLRAQHACLNCGRPLTDPASVELGYGPDCAALLAVA